MSNSTENPLTKGLCPAPFLDMGHFPKTGGYVAGRLCSEVMPGMTCCLPCPTTDWIYPQSFKTWQKVAQGFGAVGVVICAFLLLSWMFLPIDKSRRHYLSTCLVIGILLEAVAFVIPLAAKPNQCHNAVTPNDMKSDITCAFSGACIVLGGLVTTVWITFRALSMHLQICWDIVPGKKFFYSSLTIGWGVAAILFFTAMALTGVSYRFGDTCHVNPSHSLADFWIPLLTMAGIATLLQLGTLLYCCKVYMANAWSDDSDSTNSSDLPSYTPSTRTASARVVWQRVKKIVMIQWRSMAVLAFLLVDIIFFSVVWIELDDAITKIHDGKTDHLMPFLACILVNPSMKDRARCYPLGQDALISEKVSISVLLLLALTGLQTGLLMIRTTMWTGWRDMFRNRFGRNKEFVSLDAKRDSSDPRVIPMMGINSPNPRVTSAGTAETGDTLRTTRSMDSSKGQTSPFFAQQQFERSYRQPSGSFSVPRPASANSSPKPTYDGPEATSQWPILAPIRPATSHDASVEQKGNNHNRT